MHLNPRMNVMHDFICMGLVDLQGAHGKRKNEKFLLMIVGLEPTTLRFEARGSTELPGPQKPCQQICTVRTRQIIRYRATTTLRRL